MLNESSKARLLRDMKAVAGVGYTQDALSVHLEDVIEWVNDCARNAWETHGELVIVPKHIIRQALREVGAVATEG